MIFQKSVLSKNVAVYFRLKLHLGHAQVKTSTKAVKGSTSFYVFMQSGPNDLI